MRRLHLYSVMCGDAKLERRHVQSTQQQSSGPIAIVAQASTPREAYDVVMAMPNAARFFGPIGDVDAWVHQHVMRVPAKRGPVVLMVLRKDFE